MRQYEKINTLKKTQKTRFASKFIEKTYNFNLTLYLPQLSTEIKT